MAYKVVKRKHFSSKKFIFRVVNTRVNGAKLFGVNKNFDTEKEAEDYMNKGPYNRRF